jgi:hypothetical protein
MGSSIRTHSLDLTATIQATRWTGHQLYIFIVAFLGFQFSYYVLNVLKAIRLNKLETNAWISHLLVVFVFTLLID